MSFLKKSLSKDNSVGEYLSAFLSKSQLSITEIAKHAHLSERVVTALVSDNFSAISDLYYVRHLIRHLARVLGADPLLAEQLFIDKLPDKKIPQPKPEAAFAHSRTPASRFIVSARWLGALGFLFAFVALFSYFGFGVRGALLPPTITLISPSENQVTKSRMISVSGRTEPEVTISVNGESVVSDDLGRFTMPLYLEEGLNVVEVRAARRYSRETVIYRRVLVEAVVSSGRDGVSVAPTSNE